MRLKDGIAPGTINNQRVTLIAALNHAHKHGRLASVPHVSKMPPTHAQAPLPDAQGSCGPAVGLSPGAG